MDENYIATGRSRQAIERQRYTFTLILYFVFAKFMNILNQLKYGSRRLSGSRSSHELDGIEGIPVEFEWEKISQNTQTTLQLLREIQKTIDEKRIQLEKFVDRIIFLVFL